MKYNPFYWIGFFWGLVIVPYQRGREDAYFKLMPSSPLVAAQEMLMRGAAAQQQNTAPRLQ